MSEEMEHQFQEALRAKAVLMSDPAGREVAVLSDTEGMRIADRFGCTLNDVYKECLTASICPYRYMRNREAISTEEQLKLACSRVAVIGAGGLGGHVIHLLARIGIGHLVVVDCDVFEESNLNRQVFSTYGSLGKSKSEEAARRISEINAGVEVTPYTLRIDEENLKSILAGADVVVDGLDNIEDRMMLESGAKTLHIPLVHGALAGFDGQVMTIFPEDPGLTLIYGRGKRIRKDPKSPEAVQGVPALMPSMIATFQAMEVVKILLGKGKILRNKFLHVSLETGEANAFHFHPPKKE